jgi:hypothetical protein
MRTLTAEPMALAAGTSRRPRDGCRLGSSTIRPCGAPPPGGRRAPSGIDVPKRQIPRHEIAGQVHSALDEDDAQGLDLHLAETERGARCARSASESAASVHVRGVLLVAVTYVHSQLVHSLRHMDRHGLAAARRSRCSTGLRRALAVGLIEPELGPAEISPTVSLHMMGGNRAATLSQSSADSVTGPVGVACSPRRGRCHG